MKFSTVSAAATIAALSMMQAAPLSAHSSTLKVRETAAQEFAEDVKLDNEYGEAVDKRQVKVRETAAQEFAEDEKLDEEYDEAVDKRQL
ncbi:hypothetical protein CSUB01_10866 [Colletotrichum sublineola]|uniref:Uncharacterized protein n=1 Tax=Colletotrichum sublineola TaxID=1173701 RepID=A0A066X1L0_COLSU|nr:hypothetical protein CSUB01_10866 [Colletotrichum sublineola]